MAQDTIQEQETIQPLAIQGKAGELLSEIHKVLDFSAEQQKDYEKALNKVNQSVDLSAEGKKRLGGELKEKYQSANSETCEKIQELFESFELEQNRPINVSMPQFQQAQSLVTLLGDRLTSEQLRGLVEPLRGNWRNLEIMRSVCEASGVSQTTCENVFSEYMPDEQAFEDVYSLLSESKKKGFSLSKNLQFEMALKNIENALTPRNVYEKPKKLTPLTRMF